MQSFRVYCVSLTAAVVTALLLATCLAADEPARKGLDGVLQSVVDDDFATDSLAQYKVNDKVEWQPGEVLLADDAQIFRSVTAGPIARLSLHLTCGAPVNADQPMVISMGFTLGGNDAAFVSLSRKRDDQRITNDLTIRLKTSDAKNKAVFRDCGTYRLPDGEVDGAWRLTYFRGVLRVERDGQRVAAAYLKDSLISPVASGFMLVTRGACRLRHWQLHAIPRPEVPDAAALQVATKLSETMSRRNSEGHYDAAIEAGQEFLAATRRAFGDEHVMTSFPLESLGNIECLRGDSVAGRKYFTEALRLYEALEDEHPRLASASINLARSHDSQGEYVEAERHYRQAVAIHTKLLGDKDPTPAESLTALGTFLQQRERFDEAKPPLEKALTLRYHALGVRDPSIVESMLALSTLSRTRFDFIEAKKQAHAALNLCRNYHGAESELTVGTMSEVAYLHRECQEYDAAQKLYAEVLSIQRRQFGDDGPQTLKTLGYVAKLAVNRGDFAEAVRLYRQITDSQTKLFGPRHQSVGFSLWETASVFLFKLHQHDEGRQVARKAIETLEFTSQEHALAATAWMAIGWSFLEQRQFAKARESYERALVILRKSQGDEATETLTAMTLLGAVDEEERRFPTARTWYQQVLDVRQKRFGDQHPSVASSFIDLAGLAKQEHDFPKAQEFYAQALAIRTKVFGEKHLGVASLHLSLGNLLWDMGRYADARKHLEHAWEIHSQLLGDAHSETAEVLRNLASLLVDQGDYPSAREKLESAVANVRASLGAEHPDTARAIHSLGYFYQQMGNYPHARQSFAEALAVRQKLYGLNHADTATSLHSLGYLTGIEGDHRRARELIEQSLAARREVFGEDDEVSAKSYAALAELHFSHGDLVPAAEFVERCQKICERTFGTRHPRTANALFFRSVMLASQGQLSTARELMQKTLNIRRETLGEQHPDTAGCRSALAMFLRTEGKSDEAAPLLREALATLRDKLGERHPATTHARTTLAFLDIEQKNFTAAREGFQNVLDINQATYGEAHPDVLLALENLSYVRFLDGDKAGAKELLSRCIPLRVRLARDVLPALSEAEALSYCDMMLSRQPYLGVLRALPDVTPQEAYGLVWPTKGLMTQSLAERRRTISGDAQAEGLWQQIRDVRTRMSMLVFSAAAPEDQPQRQAELTRLSESKEALERQLAVADPSRRRTTAAVEDDFGKLGTMLPDGVAVVDFVRTSEFRTDGQPPPEGWGRYEAFVLRRQAAAPGYRLTWIAIGPLDPIDRAIARWREQLIRRVLPTTDPFANPERPDEELRRRLWEPIESELKGCSTVIVVPDGALTRVPWNALPGRKPNSFLLDDYALATVSSAPQVLDLLRREPVVGNDMLLVGGVGYDNEPAPHVPLTEPSRGPALTVDQQLRWRFLKGTQEEVTAIARLRERHLPAGASAPKVLSGNEASEAAVLERLPRSRYIHLATHGFFADESLRAVLPENSQQPGLGLTFELFGRRASVTARNPLLLSGVVLSGANIAARVDANSPADHLRSDGILTAEEVVNGNLSQTELVVLSACETGLGEVAGGEGVFGLQRAFGLAGVRTTVASLWQVDDHATQTLMTEFYRNLWDKRLGKLAALREAQRTMLRGYNPVLKTLDRAATIETPSSENGSINSAYFWAAFVLNGDWR